MNEEDISASVIRRGACVSTSGPPGEDRRAAAEKSAAPAPLRFVAGPPSGMRRSAPCCLGVFGGALEQFDQVFHDPLWPFEADRGDGVGFIGVLRPIGAGVFGA